MPTVRAVSALRYQSHKNADCEARAIVNFIVEILLRKIKEAELIAIRVFDIAAVKLAFNA